MVTVVAALIRIALPALLFGFGMYVASILLLHGAGPTVWFGLAVVVFLIALGDRIQENLR